MEADAVGVGQKKFFGGERTSLALTVRPCVMSKVEYLTFPLHMEDPPLIGF